MRLYDRYPEIDGMIAEGFCTHYSGYICDRDWHGDPDVCRRCIASWLLSTSKERAAENNNGSTTI